MIGVCRIALLAKSGLEPPHLTRTSSRSEGFAACVEKRVMAPDGVLLTENRWGRIDLVADRVGERAASAKATSRRDCVGRRWLAFERRTRLATTPVSPGLRVEQCPRVWVRGTREDVAAAPCLHDASEIHDGDSGSDVLDHCELMGDENHREVEFVAEVSKEIQNLRLN